MPNFFPEREYKCFLYFCVSCWGREILFFSEKTEIGLVTWRDANTRQRLVRKDNGPGLRATYDPKVKHESDLIENLA